MKKALIVYFSYTGNTKIVAEVLAEYLKQEYEVELFRLIDINQSYSFFQQSKSAFKHERAELKEINFDLASYDLICLGTPVWTFTSTPAMNAFLDKCSGIGGKEVVLFTTSGGIGDESCQGYMQELLSKKEVKSFKNFSVRKHKVQDKELVLEQIESMQLFL